jgi:hypothetical protein
MKIVRKVERSDHEGKESPPAAPPAPGGRPPAPRAGTPWRAARQCGRSGPVAAHAPAGGRGLSESGPDAHPGHVLVRRRRQRQPESRERRQPADPWGCRGDGAVRLPRRPGAGRLEGPPRRRRPRRGRRGRPAGCLTPRGVLEAILRHLWCGKSAAAGPTSNNLKKSWRDLARKGGLSHGGVGSPRLTPPFEPRKSTGFGQQRPNGAPSLPECPRAGGLTVLTKRRIPCSATCGASSALPSRSPGA